MISYTSYTYSSRWKSQNPTPIEVKIQEVEGGQKFATEFPRIRDDRVGLRVSWHENKQISHWFEQQKTRWGGIVWICCLVCFFIEIPRCSMYGICTYIYPQNYPNVGK